MESCPGEEGNRADGEAEILRGGGGGEDAEAQMDVLLRPCSVF